MRRAAQVQPAGAGRHDADARSHPESGRDWSDIRAVIERFLLHRRPVPGLQ